MWRSIILIELFEILSGKKTNLALVWLALVCIVFIVLSVDFSLHDFGNYYFGGYFLKNGLFGKSIYYPASFSFEIARLGFGNYFLSYAPNSPFIAIIFFPLAFLDPALAKFVFNTASLFLFIVSLKRLSKTCGLPALSLFFIPVIFFIPLRNGFLFGQLYLLIFALISEGFVAYKNQKWWFVALFWALATMIKILPAFLLFFLLFKKQYRPFVYFIFSLLILLLVSIFLTGWDIWEFYFTNILWRSGAGEIAGKFVDNYQSVLMFTKRILLYDNILNPNGLWHDPGLVKVVNAGVGAFFIAASALVTKRIKNDLLAIGMWLLSAIVYSPYGSTYQMILLLFLFFGIVKLRAPFAIKLVLWSLITLINFGYVYSTFSFPFNYSRLFFIFLLSAGLLYQLLRKKDWLQSILIAIIVSISFSIILPDKKDRSMPFASFNTPLLITDYNIEKDHVSYHYLNNNGLRKSTIPFNVIHYTQKDIEVRHNQIYYKGKQLTTDRYTKRKPSVINDSLILFLSDAERGIGFYNLRTIDL